MNKKKIRRYLQELRYIVPTLYFNFHYLPFRQALRLPIVLYKPHLLACKGKIRLEPEDGRIWHGMIRLGFLNSSIYPNHGITWENKGGTVMDTNFHPLFDMVTKEFKPADGPIEIGDYNWFGTGCKVMHSVTTPERCIFGMGTVVTRGCVKKSYCVMGGSPVRILSENVMRDYEHDTLKY